MGALDGVRVIDLSRAVPGPYCTMLLADMGADVVLVEGPSSEPRAVGQSAGGDPSRDVLRRGKRSVRVNLKAPEGRAVFERLLGGADVLIEGFRPGVAARLGIDHATLEPKHPRLVYCSISGYGQDGPYAQLASHDLNYQAIAGALGVELPKVPIADMGGGLMAAFAIALALFSRERTGKGQHLDVALSDAMLSMMARPLGRLFENGRVSDRITGGLPQYAVYRCADGKRIAVAPLEPWLHRSLCDALSVRPEATHKELAERFAERDRAAWLEVLRKADACAAPVHALEEVAQDPHHAARGMLAGQTFGVVPRMAGTPGAAGKAGPKPGQHTDEVLAQLGCSAAEIAALRSAGAVE